MSPALLPGDDLLVEAAAWQLLRTGDIVLFERSEALLAHRLIRIERNTSETRLITKGDAAESYDSPVPVESYLGKATRAVRNGHVINIDGPGGRAAARLHMARWVLKTMMTRLTHTIQERLGIASALIIALLIFSATAASAAVSVSSFGANGNQGQITLSWTTATEMSNFGFNLDRSTDQTTWKNVTFVPGQSPCMSTTTGYTYRYTDNSNDLVSTTTYYYRLQLVGKQCGDQDQYYNRTVSASPNGGKGPAPTTPTPTVQPTIQPSPTATSQPTAAPTAVPPTATPSSVPPATSTSTPQPQDTLAPTNTPVPSATPSAINTVAPAGPAASATTTPRALRFTPTATPAAGAQQPATAEPIATQTPAVIEQPAVSTDTPAADAATASPQATEIAMVVATSAPSAQAPQSSQRPVQSQPTPAPAAGTNLLVGIGLLGVLGMGAAGFLLLGLAGVVLWRFYARG